MTTRARKSGDEYILNGEKMWITSGTIADVAVVWAKLEGDEGSDPVRGFLVEDRPARFLVERHSWQMVAARLGDQRPDASGRARAREANLLPGATGTEEPR